jgi:hypothetical protein
VPTLEGQPQRCQIFRCPNLLQSAKLG